MAELPMPTRRVSEGRLSVAFDPGVTEKENAMPIVDSHTFTEALPCDWLDRKRPA
jgi:hypothetical protein